MSSSHVVFRKHQDKYIDHDAAKQLWEQCVLKYPIVENDGSDPGRSKKTALVIIRFSSMANSTSIGGSLAERIISK
jgi:hypothetical protein